MSESAGSAAERLGRVAAKLEGLRARSRPDVRISQRYVLKPALAEDAVIAFEERHGVRLPEEYRAFVTTLGNGGAGPYRGLEPLDPDRHHVSLMEGFPFHPEEFVGPAWTRGHGPDALSCGTLWLNRQYDEEWRYHDPAEIWTLLVVSGPGRGRMVVVEKDNDFFDPIYHPARDFIAWYEDWLDREVSGGRSRLRTNDFERPGDSLGHSDVEEAVWAARTTGVLARVLQHQRPSALQIANLGATAAPPRPARVRAAAMWALATGCSQGATSAIVPALRDTDPTVRLQAVRALRAQQDADATVVFDAVRPLLADVTPAVRRAAISVLTRIPDAESATVRDTLRPLLTDSDPGTRAAAFEELAHRDEWAFDTVRDLVGSPDAEIRRSALVALHNAHWLAVREDRDHAVSRAAVREIAQGRLADTDAAVRERAVRILGNIADAE
ncbi:HEAT repeat domain-containing protein [Actinoallomurus sp. NPDC050550]|uniref:HEAT repeat domain-containing protein n=1 Tax=Actinoallomurus sp. NPDC050550 TaxID=3154937 RepID=UPI0033FF35D7